MSKKIESVELIYAQHVAAKLKELRNKRKLTLDELAAGTKISKRAISLWEAGSNLPSNRLLLKLARFYGVSWNQLLQ